GQPVGATRRSHMKAKLTLLVYLLLIPAAALGTAKAIKDDLDSQWQSALEKAYPQDGAKLAEVVSLGKVCADSDMRGDLKDGCTLYDRVNLMDRVALGTGIIGIVLLASIALAGRLARRRRRLLLALFRPGLPLTMLTLSLLTFLHAGLGIAAIYYGESVFLGQLHVKLLFALAIGGIVGIVAMLQAQWSAVKK